MLLNYVYNPELGYGMLSIFPPDLVTVWGCCKLAGWTKLQVRAMCVCTSTVGDVIAHFY
jgi:hypothetical protein